MTLVGPGMLTDESAERVAVDFYKENARYTDNVMAVTNRSHYFGLGDLIQVVFNELGFTDITQIGAETILETAMASGITDIDYFAHSQGTQVAYGGFDLADPAVFQNMNINYYGMGGQTTIYQGEFGLNSVTNIRVVDSWYGWDPIPYLAKANPINLVKGAIYDFDANLQTIKSGNLTALNSLPLSLDRHHWDTYYYDQEMPRMFY